MSDDAHDQPAILRVSYLGEAPRSGRVAPLAQDDPHASTLPGVQVLTALSDGAFNIDLSGFVPFFFSRDMDGWAPLLPGSVVPVLPPQPSLSGVAVRRVEVRMERRHRPPPRPPAFSGEGSRDEAVAADTPRDAVSGVTDGYFGIGIYCPKFPQNVGTLWRSAHQMGASFLYTVGSRNPWATTADTIKAWRSVPAWRYGAWADFMAAAPFQAKLVAVEFGHVNGIALSAFEHPERAIYLLGAEDHGLPDHVVRACHCCVYIESEREESFNVAVAGSILMYDRLVKRSRGRGGAAEDYLPENPPPAADSPSRGRGGATSLCDADATNGLSRSEWGGAPEEYSYLPSDDSPPGDAAATGSPSSRGRGGGASEECLPSDLPLADANAADSPASSRGRGGAA
jgi:tRNA(Leu) C34 or U34 (ribose-2'-O)-methylase TrmL